MSNTGNKHKIDALKSAVMSLTDLIERLGRASGTIHAPEIKDITRTLQHEFEEAEEMVDDTGRTGE